MTQLKIVFGVEIPKTWLNTISNFYLVPLSTNFANNFFIGNKIESYRQVKSLIAITVFKVEKRSQEDLSSTKNPF